MADDLDTFEQVLAQVASAPEIEPALRLREGETIGERYVVEKELGAGGMGRVYLARDTQLKREVAIKLLTGVASAAALDRLLDEARAMAALSHPNVVTVHEVGSVAGQMFLAMEHMPGGSLRAYLADHDDEETIIARFIEAGRGLEAAHAEGIIHRDFKPDNVLLSRDGRACVADFGLARPALTTVTSELAKGSPTPAQIQEQASTSRDSAGTPAYMAPEQLEGGAAHARSDQFSFCVALWEGLLGELPFRGKGRGEPAAPPARLPARVRHVLRRGLSINPKDRFESMADLLGELEPQRGDPAKAIVLVATLALTLGAAAMIYFGRSSDAVSCASTSDLTAQIFPAEYAQTIRAAFSATTLAYAPALADKIAALVPQRIGELDQGRAQACRAARVSGLMSDASYERALACFDNQERRLRAQVAQWAVANQGIVEQAHVAIRELPDASPCTDQLHLAASGTPPSKAIAPAVAALRSRLAAVEVGRRGGDLADADKEAIAVVAEARELDYAPLLAEALYQYGAIAREQGNTDKAVTALREAYVTAREADADITAAEATGELAYALAIAGGDAKAAELWRDLLAVEARKGTGGPRMEFAALDKLGAIADFQGNYEKALEYRQRGYAIATAEYADAPLIVARAEANLGLTWHALGKLKDAVSRYEKALAIITKEVGPNHPMRALLLGNAGLANAELGNTEVAVDQLEAGLAIEKTIFGERAIEVGYTLLNLGVADHHAKQFERALVRYQQALEIVVERLGPEHPDVALVENSIGVAYEGLDKLDEAIEWQKKALAITRAQDENHPNVAIVIANIGEVQRKGGQLPEALASFNDAISRWEKLGNDGANLVHPLTGAGEVLIELGRTREAARLLERAVKLSTDGSSEHAERAAKALERARAGK